MYLKTWWLVNIVYVSIRTAPYMTDPFHNVTHSHKLAPAFSPSCQWGNTKVWFFLHRRHKNLQRHTTGTHTLITSAFWSKSVGTVQVTNAEELLGYSSRHEHRFHCLSLAFFYIYLWILCLCIFKYCILNYLLILLFNGIQCFISLHGYPLGL